MTLKKPHIAPTKTIKLSESLHQQLKISAAQEGASIQDMVEYALCEVYGFERTKKEDNDR